MEGLEGEKRGSVPVFPYRKKGGNKSRGVGNGGGAEILLEGGDDRKKVAGEF